MSSKSKIARAAGVMSAATLISRILGYIKDMVLAKFFGAGAMADVFFVAFRIPNLLRELFAEGSMSSAFVPVLTEEQTKNGREEANRLVSSVFVFITLVVGLLCLVGIIFAPAIVTVIAPGFLDNPEKFKMSVLLTRIMLPFLLFISLASLTMGALNTRGVFFIPALAPAFLNIVTIICVVSLSSYFTEPIISVAIGITAGGMIQFLFQIPSFLKHGFSFKFQTSNFKSKFRNPAMKKIGRLIIPATAGMAVSQINIFISTILASYLAEGSITYLYYSMRLIQFPIGIFGVAMGMAVLPQLSEHAAKGENGKLKEDFSFALRLLFFITVPAMAGLIALKEPIVSALFQRGRFDSIATINTAQALMFYSFGIWAVVGGRIATAAFYSMQDTKTPVKTAAAAMVINISLSVALMGVMKHNGLALAHAIASTSNFLILFYLLRARLEGVGVRLIASSFSKTALSSAIMGIIGFWASQSDIWSTNGQNLQKAAYLCTVIAVCAASYFFVSYIFKSEELGFMIDKLKSKIGRPKITK